MVDPGRIILYLLIVALTALAGLFFHAPCCAINCETAVNELNTGLAQRIEPTELVEILRTLDKTKNRELPPKFITKKEASKAGWKPGKSLWSVRELKGMSIGGDRFGNYEKKLPNGKRTWREADLDYQGGGRGPKRIVFSSDGMRMLTVDHYQTFIEVPKCQ